MAVVTGVQGCQGPAIPYSYGRTTATVASPALVPEPQQPLSDHISAFKRMGFNQTEMIEMVACGHTVSGGVRRVDFPAIVQDETVELAFFDSTSNFDNAMYVESGHQRLQLTDLTPLCRVNEYLNDTTQNVLVVGPNITTRSDGRIFGSDGNATMWKSVILYSLRSVPSLTIHLTGYRLPTPSAPPAAVFFSV
jgi:hypothetical protein